MNPKNSFRLLVVLTVLSLILGACQTKQVIQTAVVTQVVKETVKETAVVTQVVKETVKETQVVEVVPTPVPSNRTGAWLDSVTFVNIDQAEAAVAQLAAGDIDAYAYTVAKADVFKTVRDNADLTYNSAYGTIDGVLFNGADKFTSGELNPFGASPRLREAMNYLIDRDYVVQEIMTGMGTPKFLPISSAFPDYTKYIDTVKRLETQYAYSPEKAKAIVDEEMPKLGATLGADGKWQYNGKPLVLKFLIRTEDERKNIGDYVSNQLETVGFTVDRQYKTRSEASPIWMNSDPYEGQWHLYTAGWINTRIDRDSGANFDAYYTKRGGSAAVYAGFNPTPEFDALALRLSTNNYASLEERDQLFPQAMEMALADTNVLWVVDVKSFTPYRAGVQATYDLAGSIEGTSLWPYNLRWAGKEGGTMKVAQPGLFVDPWNPIGGSNWIYDSFPQRGTGDWGAIYDPYTGLVWPKNIEKAEVTAVEGLPIAKTLDWVDLKFEKEIKVPADAWADWDATNQKFITVGEKYPDGITSKTKVTVTYPADLFKTQKWHDGSPLSVGDFVMGMIMAFDQGKPESAIYDEATVSTVSALLSHFKGVKIVSTDPLVIETYDDAYFLDAEWCVKAGPSGVDGYTWFPYYSFGQAPWQTVGMGVKAEANKETAFSSDKANTIGKDQMSFIAGPTLEVLKATMDAAATENYIPYAPTMGQFVTADEAKTRWANLQDWYARRGHFWIGTGPFTFDKAFPTEKVATLKRNPDYAEPAGKWSRFSTPQVATVAIDGGAVKIGTEAKFDVTVTYNDQPYATADLAAVKYLLVNQNGDVIATGDATPVQDGQFQVVISADVTGKLEAGSVKLLVAVSSKLVSLPAFETIEVVVTP